MLWVYFGDTDVHDCPQKYSQALTLLTGCHCVLLWSTLHPSWVSSYLGCDQGACWERLRIPYFPRSHSRPTFTTRPNDRHYALQKVRCSCLNSPSSLVSHSSGPELAFLSHLSSPQRRGGTESIGGERDRERGRWVGGRKSDGGQWASPTAREEAGFERGRDRVREREEVA